MRLIQHKKEAFIFYRFLSVFYDNYVNPLFWTKKMRDESLALADLDSRELKVIDVGSGTGFTTQGIAEKVDTKNIICIDQSPHQVAKAREKADLQGCDFNIGDAENLPFNDDTFDRYVSAGSIEYWPNPALGISEAYRILRPGGKALIIGPLEPEHPFGRWIANTWMLFPKVEEYKAWYEACGFTDIRSVFVAPNWHTRENFGMAIVGTKTQSGKSALHDSLANTETVDEKRGLPGFLKMIWRLIVGSLAGFLFIPVALFGYLRFAFRGQKNVPPEYREKLTTHQLIALIIIFIVIALIIYFITR